MTCYHQILVPRNDISGHAAAGFAYQRPMAECARHFTGTALAFQMFVAYSAIVRSLENLPEHPTLIIALRVHASVSW